MRIDSDGARDWMFESVRCPCFLHRCCHLRFQCWEPGYAYEYETTAPYMDRASLLMKPNRVGGILVGHAAGGAVAHAYSDAESINRINKYISYILHVD